MAGGVTWMRLLVTLPAETKRFTPAGTLLKVAFKRVPKSVRPAVCVTLIGRTKLDSELLIMPGMFWFPGAVVPGIPWPAYGVSLRRHASLERRREFLTEGDSGYRYIGGALALGQVGRAACRNRQAALDQAHGWNRIRKGQHRWV